MLASRLLPNLFRLLLSAAGPLLRPTATTFAAALTIALTAATAPARAAPVDRDPREVEARRLCDSGQVRSGVALLAQLHVETLNPLHVYRQALCFQHNGHDEGAIDRYR